MAQKVDAEKLLSHLHDKWQGRTCPMCGVARWNVSDTIYELREFNQGNFVIGGPITPIVPVTCDNCGNTVLINAIVAKLVEPSKKL